MCVAYVCLISLIMNIIYPWLWYMLLKNVNVNDLNSTGISNCYMLFFELIVIIWLGENVWKCYDLFNIW